VFYSATATSPPSGLFVASCGDTRTGMITPPAPVIRGFAGLGMTPQLAHSPRSVKSIESLIRLYELWATARIVHTLFPLAFGGEFLLRIELEICDLLYGEAKQTHKAFRCQICLRATQHARYCRKLVRSIPEGAVRSNHRFSWVGGARTSYESTRGLLRSTRFSLWFPTPAAIPSPDSFNGRPWMAEFALRLRPALLTLWSPGLRIGYQRDSNSC